MIRRRVAAFLALLFWLSLAGIGHAQGTVSDAEATAAIKSWLDALSTGDPTRVDPLLAPEFQLIRGDRTYTKAEYLKAMAKLAPGYRIDALVVTSDGDSLVTRYILTADVTAEGQKLQETAPRRRCSAVSAAAGSSSPTPTVHGRSSAAEYHIGGAKMEMGGNLVQRPSRSLSIPATFPSHNVSSQRPAGQEAGLIMSPILLLFWIFSIPWSA